MDYTTATNQRDFGTISLPPTQAVDGDTDLATILVKRGLVRVRRPEGKREPTEQLLTLLALEEEAVAAKHGLHGDLPVTRVVSSESAEAILLSYKGQAIPCICENVRDGSTFWATVKLPNGTSQQILVQLSGIRAPSIKEGVSEPFADEAKFFFEVRLLQRDFQIIPEGMFSGVKVQGTLADSFFMIYLSKAINNNAIVGSIVHPAGNIAIVLLSEGLAKVNDWTVNVLSGGSSAALQFRQAETQAKEENRRLWKNYKASAPSLDSSQENNFDATVIRIVSADTINVISTKTQKEYRISLSSVRAPKLKDPKEGFYNGEAKEALRKRLIGKTVNVFIDYVKPANSEGDVSYDEKIAATIKLNNLNIGESLIEKGLLFVLRHRKDDEKRSKEYDILLIASQKAEEGKKGVFSETPITQRRLVDSSETAVKAKSFLTFYARSNLNCVVDFVSSPSRFRLVCPKEAAKLTVVLAGIRVPRTSRNPGEKGEPFAAEALDFVTRFALQRDVEARVESVDRTGAFVGTLYVSLGEKSVNLAVELVRRGFATVHDYTANQSQFGRELAEAEREARQGKAGLWSIEGYVKAGSEERLEGLNEALDATSLVDFKISNTVQEVIVSDVRADSLSVQIVGDGIKKLEDLMAKFADHHSSSTVPEGLPRVSVGELVSAKFSHDGSWYRAKVIKVSSNKKNAFLVYVDYGNSEELPLTRLRPLPPQFSTLPPQAKSVTLAFISLPASDSDFHIDAIETLSDMTGSTGKLFLQSLEGSSNSVVLLTESQNLTRSLNLQLVKMGLAVVRKDILKKHNLDQQNALKDKVQAFMSARGGSVDKSPVQLFVDAMDEARSKRVR